MSEKIGRLKPIDNCLPWYKGIIAAPSKQADFGGAAEIPVRIRAGGQEKTHSDMTAFWILVSAFFAVLALTIAVVNLVDWEDLETFEKVGYSSVLVLGIILGGLSGWLLAESTKDTNQQQITTMASKSMKPARPVAPAPLTEEQKKEQVLRYIAQQRNSIYQMALANIIQANPVEADGKYYADKVTALAKDIADRSIAILFSVDEKKEGEE